MGGGERREWGTDKKSEHQQIKIIYLWQSN